MLPIGLLVGGWHGRDKSIDVHGVSPRCAGHLPAKAASMAAMSILRI